MPRKSRLAQVVIAELRYHHRRAVKEIVRLCANPQRAESFSQAARELYEGLSEYRVSHQHPDLPAWLLSFLVPNVSGLVVIEPSPFNAKSAPRVVHSPMGQERTSAKLSPGIASNEMVGRVAWGQERTSAKLSPGIVDKSEAIKVLEMVEIPAVERELSHLSTGPTGTTNLLDQ